MLLSSTSKIPKFIIALRTHFLMLFVAGLLAYLACSIGAGYLDTFFYDLKGYITSPPFSEEQAVEVSISKLKTGERNTIRASDLASFIDRVVETQPHRIVLAIKPSEISGSISEMESLAAKIGETHHLFLYSRSVPENSFKDTPVFKDLPNHIVHKMTSDKKLMPYDEKTRRLVLSMDGKDWDSDLLSFFNLLDIAPPALKDIDGTFLLFDSKQMYLRFYDLTSLESYSIEADEINTPRLRGKIVFIGTNDSYSGFSRMHPFSRFTFQENQSLDNIISDARYLLNLFGNMKKFDFIKTPSPTIQWLWIFIIYYLHIFLGWKYSDNPKLYLYLSLSLLLIAFAFSIFVFRYHCTNLDNTRVTIGGLLLQYFALPVLLVKGLRRADEFRLAAEKQRAQDQIRMQYLMRLAKADFGLKITAKISHDIRGPLMALQVANNFINGMVPAEVHQIITDSTLRLKNIADDTLEMYKGKTNGVMLSQTNVSTVFDDLLRTYKSVYPKINFNFESHHAARCYVPALTLKRCLSNVLNNSVEALERCTEPRKIKMSANTNNDHVIIYVEDNGPGIPKEIKSKLFQERATFGKTGGTGLGLHQVRSELKIYGGTIELDESDSGAIFQIQLPRMPKSINFEVANQVMIIEHENNIYSALEGGDLGGTQFTRVKTAIEALKTLPLKGEWTILLNFSFELDEDLEAHFELMKKLETYQNIKIVIFTQLDDNPDVQKFADSYGAQLIGQNQLRFVRFMKKSLPDPH